MTFTEIAQQTKVQPNEIEHLIMKALSLGLVRGTIDQVAEVARITWVQPVLDKGRLSTCAKDCVLGTMVLTSSETGSSSVKRFGLHEQYKGKV